jgi:(p)ppGpp synthase/HD superfamily hydrolase
VNGHGAEIQGAGSLNFQITVNNRLHLANIMRHLRHFPEVIRIQRGNHTQQPDMLSAE